MDAALPSAEIHWSVPKFDVDSNLELTDALKALGVTDVFDFDKSDFSPLIDEEKFDESVAVTQVQHAARVKVDERAAKPRRSRPSRRRPPPPCPRNFQWWRWI